MLLATHADAGHDCDQCDKRASKGGRLGSLQPPKGSAQPRIDLQTAVIEAPGPRSERRTPKSPPLSVAACQQPVGSIFGGTRRIIWTCLDKN